MSLLQNVLLLITTRLYRVSRARYDGDSDFTDRFINGERLCCYLLNLLEDQDWSAQPVVVGSGRCQLANLLPEARNNLTSPLIISSVFLSKLGKHHFLLAWDS